MRRPAAEKVAFVLGVAGMMFLYGYGARAFGWFPHDLVERAWHQARAISPISLQQPDYLSGRVYDWHGARSESPDEMQPGLTLVASNWEKLGWDPGLRLMDAEGRALHQWRVRPTSLFGDVEKYLGVELRYQTIHDFHLFDDGEVVVNLDYVGMARLDACGNVLWRLPERTHHSLARARDGSFWTAVRVSADTGIEGLGSVMHDHLLRVSEEGEVLEEIEVLDALYEAGLYRYVPKNRYPHSGDYTHINDVEPLGSALADEYPMFEAGDLLVSAKAPNLVFVIDPETKEIEWHATGPFIRQHDPDFIGDGWIGIFDNNEDRTFRGQLLGGSRIVAMEPHTDSTRVLFPTSESDPFYTAIAGKWEQLGNGNYLLIEAMPGRVVEVTPDGRTVWQWVQKPYGEAHVPHVLAAKRYSLTPEEVGAWKCSGEASAAIR